MDSFRDMGQEHSHSWQASDSVAGMDTHDAPPPPIGVNQRRMHIRAYNSWAKILGDRRVPLIADLYKNEFSEFEANSVVLDFTGNRSNPDIRYTGKNICNQCGIDDPKSVTALDKAPAATILSEISRHYQGRDYSAPESFEDEFDTGNDIMLLYRGIFLPFSSDGSNIDHVVAVANWKEMAKEEWVADARKAIEKKKSAQDELKKPKQSPGVLLAGFEFDDQQDPLFDHPPADETQTPYLQDENRWPEPLPSGNSSLGEWVDYAQVMAKEARHCKYRSQAALNRTLGRAYDVLKIAAQSPDEMHGLQMARRADGEEETLSETVVRLVFAADCDPAMARLYKDALEFALQLDLPVSSFADFLKHYDGGVESFVDHERQRRNRHGADQQGQSQPLHQALLGAMQSGQTGKLRERSPESDYMVVVIMRNATGQLDIIGSLDDQHELKRAVLDQITPV